MLHNYAHVNQELPEAEAQSEPKPLVEPIMTEIETSSLANAISLILKSPYTPEIIRHHLGDITYSTIQSMIDYDTPEMIEIGLRAYERSGACDADNERILGTKEATNADESAD